MRPDPAPLRFATRGSPQARSQAQVLADAVAAATGTPTELLLVETTGDRVATVPLHVIGGQGVFVKEVQQAVLDGRADVAVHSAKDLPGLTQDGLRLAAFHARRDVADALVGRRLDELAGGATVATGSVRRRAQLGAVRPDLVFAELRGNIASRLDKVPAAGSIVMAMAALEVLELTGRVAERLDPTRFVPAVGQGCVAAECRSADGRSAELLAAVDDAPTRFAVSTERAYLAELGAGCTLPLGAWCDGQVLHAFLAGESPGATVFRETVAVDDDPQAAGDAAAAVARRARAAVDR